MPADKERLPSTLERSAEKVKRAYEQAAQSGRAARDHPRATAGGVDASKTKDQLLADARAAGIEGRSSMTKAQLVKALLQHSDRETAKARRKG